MAPQPIPYGNGPVPYTAIRPKAPSVAVMWVNAFLSWSALPALYLLYLTIRNVVWAREHGQPWVRYVLPLATVVGVVVVGVILLSQVNTQTPADSYYQYP